MAVFGLILAMFLTFQSYAFDAFEHAWAPLGENGCAKFYETNLCAKFMKFMDSF